jgi:ryanodine receptor 2
LPGGAASLKGGEAMTYKPRPIDTSAVELSPDLHELVERLSESNHDIWAAKRIAEGWRHGPKRDDDLKTHPDLVPYAELPESEKEYDRESVIGILKAIHALGYRVEKR